MQFKYSSNLPVGLKIKQTKKVVPQEANNITRKHWTRLRIKVREISNPFSSARRRSWNSLLPALSTTAGHPTHTARAEVLRMEQHITLSLAFLSLTGPDGNAEGTAHPTPDKSIQHSPRQTGSRTALVHPGCSDNLNGQRKPLGKGQRKTGMPPVLMEIAMAAPLQDLEEIPVQSLSCLCLWKWLKVKSVWTENEEIVWEGYQAHHGCVESAPLPLSLKSNRMKLPAGSICSTHPSLMIFSVSLATW